jgi:hypothetical protein
MGGEGKYGNEGKEGERRRRLYVGASLAFSLASGTPNINAPATPECRILRLIARATDGHRKYVEKGRLTPRRADEGG